LSGVVLGAFLGAVALTQIDFSASGAELLAVKGVVPVITAGAAFTMSNRDVSVGKICHNVLCVGQTSPGTMAKVKDMVKNAASGAVTKIKAIPSPVTLAIKQQVEPTVDGIQRIPKKLQAVEDIQGAAV
jgi:hypothetical protein